MILSLHTRSQCVYVCVIFSLKGTPDACVRPAENSLIWCEQGGYFKKLFFYQQ